MSALDEVLRWYQPVKPEHRDKFAAAIAEVSDLRQKIGELTEARDAAQGALGEAVKQLEESLPLAFRAAERCRNEKGPCWCGCHMGTVAMDENNPGV
jgi:hypothetical protein